MRRWVRLERIISRAFFRRYGYDAVENMEVIEMSQGEPLFRVRERAPTPEPASEEEGERFQTVPERLREG